MAADTRVNYYWEQTDEDEEYATFRLILRGPKEDRDRIAKASWISFEKYVHLYYQTDGEEPK